MSSHKAYLGDGVYADLEHGSLVLTTEDGICKTNRIVLEPEVLSSLYTYFEHKKSHLKYDRVWMDAQDRTKCRLILLPSVAPGWGCCQCLKDHNAGTYNSLSREECKECGHKRCVPIPDDFPRS